MFSSPLSGQHRGAQVQSSWVARLAVVGDARRRDVLDEMADQVSVVVVGDRIVVGTDRVLVSVALLLPRPSGDVELGEAPDRNEVPAAPGEGGKVGEEHGDPALVVH